MHADRHVQLLRRGPQRVVVITVKRQIGRRSLPDHRAAQAGLLAALQLLHRVGNVEARQVAYPEEPIRRGRAVFDDPVVVDAKTRFLQRDVGQSVEVEAKAG